MKSSHNSPPLRSLLNAFIEKKHDEQLATEPPERNMMKHWNKVESTNRERNWTSDQKCWELNTETFENKFLSGLQHRYESRKCNASLFEGEKGSLRCHHSPLGARAGFGPTLERLHVGRGWLNSARTCTRPMEKPSQVLRLVKESLWSSLHIKAGLNMSLQSSKCPIPDYQQHYRVTHIHTYIQHLN